MMCVVSLVRRAIWNLGTKIYPFQTMLSGSTGQWAMGREIFILTASAWHGVAWRGTAAARRGARLETSVPQISLFSAKALLPTLLLYPGAPLFGYPLYPSHQSTPRLDTLLAEYAICLEDEIL